MLFTCLYLKYDTYTRKRKALSGCVFALVYPVIYFCSLFHPSILHFWFIIPSYIFLWFIIPSTLLQVLSWCCSSVSAIERLHLSVQSVRGVGHHTLAADIDGPGFRGQCPGLNWTLITVALPSLTVVRAAIDSSAAEGQLWLKRTTEFIWKAFGQIDLFVNLFLPDGPDHMSCRPESCLS